MMPVRPSFWYLLLPFWLAGGCCSLARLFCGPDKSPWVSVGYATPERTLATFLEAVRRDNVNVVYHCLSNAYKDAHGLSGMAAAVAWERMRQENPYLHLLGSVPIPPQPVERQDNGVTYELDVDGTPLRIHLARVHFVEILYRTASGEPKEVSRYLDATLNGHVRIERVQEGGEPKYTIDGDALSTLRLERPVEFAHPGVDELPLEQLDQFRIGREWKISDVVLPQQPTR